MKRCGSGSTFCENRSRPEATLQAGEGARPTQLDIQILHIQRVVFDEFAAGFDIFAHQGGEDGFALGDVFKPYGE